MSDWLDVGRLMDDLETTRLVHREAYVKQGRSRRVEWGPMGLRFLRGEEEGWAVRAGSDRGSFFLAASGPAPRRTRWPHPDGETLQLPQAGAVAPWRPPPEIDVPLLVETEARGWIERLAGELTAALPGARLLAASLDDGESSSWLLNSWGLRAASRTRAAAVAVHAGLPRRGIGVHLYRAATAARRFDAAAVAAELVRLLVARGGDSGRGGKGGKGSLGGGTAGRDLQGEFVLSPAVVGRLLAGFEPLWVGEEARARAAGLTDRQGRVAAPRLTVVDDPRRCTTVCGEAVDGEGVGTARRELIGEGVYGGVLGARGEGGNLRRPGWRDVPRLGLAQQFVQGGAADAGTTAELIAGVEHGAWLLEAGGGAATVDIEADRFDLPVCGYAIEAGSLGTPLGPGRLRGSVRALLRGIRHIGSAEAIELVPLGALHGGPPLIATSLTLHLPPAPPP